MIYQENIIRKVALVTSMVKSAESLDMLASRKNNSSRPTSNKNDSSKLVFGRNNGSKLVSRKNNGNNEIDGFGVDSNSVEHIINSRKSKAQKLSKSKESFNDRIYFYPFKASFY